MKTEFVSEFLVQSTRHGRNPWRIRTVALALGLLWAAAVHRGEAQIFPIQGDDSTFSMGVFRITVDPAFRALMEPAGALVAYTGYNIAAGELTSPLCIDNSTTIGRSGRHSRSYAFPQPLGLGSWDVINGYADYPFIPPMWSAAPPPTEEVLTEIKSFKLLSVSPGPAGQHCPPDPRVPSVPLSWPMVKAGTFAGVSPRSLGMVQENVANGGANPDFPARSFFDIFVEVNLPPLPGTESGLAFPATGAVLYNDSPLIITNQNLTGFPPEVVYIHGTTTAVPLKFRTANAPYWNAGDIFGYLVLAGHGTLSVDCNNPNSYDTEMLQLDIAGGGLPAGLMIRESPTLASTGGVGIQPQPDGTFAIQSFFDVFTELSVDFGATWVAATNRHHVKLVCPTPPTNNFLPPTNCYYTNFTAVLRFPFPFTNIVVTNIVHRGWLTNWPPPTTPTTHTFNSLVDGKISVNGGLTFSPFTAPALCTVMVSPGSSSSAATTALLDAALGPEGNSAPEMPIEWLRPTNLCPSPGSTFDSVKGTNSDGTSLDVVKFVVNGSFIIYTRNFSHSQFPNPIPPPPPGVAATYAAPLTLVNLEMSEDGMQWFPAIAQGPLQVMIHNKGSTGTSMFDTEMLTLNLQGASPMGSFFIRESPTKQSLGGQTIRNDPYHAGNYRISSFFDVFLELSIDGGQTWIPADRSIRVQASAPPPAPNSLFINTLSQGPGAELQWIGPFTLQSSADVGGPYADVPGSTGGPSLNTWIVAPNPDVQFLRLRQ